MRIASISWCGSPWSLWCVVQIGVAVVLCAWTMSGIDGLCERPMVSISMKWATDTCTIDQWRSAVLFFCSERCSQLHCCGGCLLGIFISSVRQSKLSRNVPPNDCAPLHLNTCSLSNLSKSFYGLREKTCLYVVKEHVVIGGRHVYSCRRECM